MGQCNPNRIESAVAGAALTPANALDIVSDETGANGAVLVPLSSDVLPMIPLTASMAGSHETYFEDSLYPQGQRYSALPSLLRTGIADDFDAMLTEQIKRHPCCQECLAPDGLRRLAGVYLTSDTDTGITSIERSVKNGPSSPSNCAGQLNSRGKRHDLKTVPLSRGTHFHISKIARSTRSNWVTLPRAACGG